METQLQLENLPPELLLEISTYFKSTDFIAAANTSTKFFNLFGDIRKLALDLAQKLRTHIARGQKDEAEFLLKKFPTLLLIKGMATDFSGRKIIGTPLQIALGAMDTYQSWRAFLMRWPGDFTRNDLADLPYSRSIPGYIRSGNKLFYVHGAAHVLKELHLERGISMEFDIDQELNRNNQGNVDLHEGGIQLIEERTGHMHDESMVQMLIRYLKTLPHGEEEVAKQIAEQFPIGWEEEVNQRAIRDTTALNQAKNELLASNTAKQRARAIQKFRRYLAHENNKVFTTGIHFNLGLLTEANKLLASMNGVDQVKKDAFIIRILGSIQRYLPANDAYAICHDLSDIPYGMIINRSFGQNNYYPLDLNPNFRLGYEYSLVPPNANATYSYSCLKEVALNKVIRSVRKSNWCTIL